MSQCSVACIDLFRLATKLKQLAEQYDAREEVSRTVEDVSVIHKVILSTVS